MGSPPTLDPAPTRRPDPTRQAVAGDSELLEHLQTPAAIGGHEFGVEDRRAGGAAHRIVPESDHLRMQDFARTDAADGYGHPVAAIRVEPWLRTIAFAGDDDRRLRRARFFPGRRLILGRLVLHGLSVESAGTLAR